MQLLGGRKPAELLALPKMRIPTWSSPSACWRAISASAYMADQGLFALLVLRIVRLSLEHGNSRLSSFGYVVYGVLLAAALDDPATGREFGQLAVELSARFRDPMLHARVRYLRAGLIDQWTRGARAGVGGADRGLQGADGERGLAVRGALHHRAAVAAGGSGRSAAGDPRGEPAVHRVPRGEEGSGLAAHVPERAPDGAGADGRGGTAAGFGRHGGAHGASLHAPGCDRAPLPDAAAGRGPGEGGGDGAAAAVHLRPLPRGHACVLPRAERGGGVRGGECGAEAGAACR